MKLKPLAALVPLSVVLCGTDIQVEPQNVDPNVDVKHAHEVYVHDLEALVAQQLEEISSLVSNEEAKALRSQHYDWKLQRDTRCRYKGLREEGPHAELECLSVATEEYYAKLEARIEALRSEAPEPGAG